MNRLTCPEPELLAIQKEELSSSLEGNEWPGKAHPIHAIREAHRKEWEERKGVRADQDAYEARKAAYEENPAICEVCGKTQPYTGKGGRYPKKCEECRGLSTSD